MYIRLEWEEKFLIFCKRSKRRRRNAAAPACQKVEETPRNAGVCRRKQPPSEEGGGTAKAVTEGEKSLQFSRCLQSIYRVFSPPVSFADSPCWDPDKAKGFVGERRSSGMSELSHSCGSEGYKACDDDRGGLLRCCRTETFCSARNIVFRQAQAAAKCRRPQMDQPTLDVVSSSGAMTTRMSAPTPESLRTMSS